MDKSWKNNNLLIESGEHYLNKNKKYHYLRKPLTYDYMTSIQNNPEALYNNIFKYHFNQYVGYDSYEDLKNGDKETMMYYTNTVLEHGKSNIINLYRGIILYPNMEFDLNELGVCWAWDLDGVRKVVVYNMYEAKRKIDVDNSKIIILKATTNRDNIDWGESIFLNHKYGQEHELRIYDPQKLKLVDKDIFKISDIENGLTSWIQHLESIKHTFSL